MIGAAELALMKPSARLINTSRGPLVDTNLHSWTHSWNRRIAGAAIDVFDVEPLPDDHPYRRAPNLLATPHIGYVTRGLHERAIGTASRTSTAWLDHADAAQ